MRKRRWMIWLMLIVVLAAIGIGLYLRNQERTIELQPTAQPTSTPAPTAVPEPAATAEPVGPDYDDSGSWAYFALGEDRGVDVFIVCPTVDTRSERNSFDLNDKLKGKFVNALDMEKGIFEDAGRMYSPYYRQMSINAYRLPEADRAEARAIAYADISAAFRWYLDHENGDKPLILAGFSQGARCAWSSLRNTLGIQRRASPCGIG